MPAGSLTRNTDRLRITKRATLPYVRAVRTRKLSRSPRKSGSIPNSGCPFGPGATRRPAGTDGAALFTAPV